jgi:KUP system potassium uptake protein
MRILHTSAQAMGQVYVPAVNWALLAAVAAAVVGFGSSSRLASAYGVAVMGTMLATTFLTFFVIRFGWGYALWLCVGASGFFMLIEGVFLAAALHKVLDGGWFPLALAGRDLHRDDELARGREALYRQLRSASVPLEAFMRSLLQDRVARVPGTAVFLTATPDATPHALLHSLKHYNVLHERVVFLTVEFRDAPWVPIEERLACESLDARCWRVQLRYGFMNHPDLAGDLALAGSCGVELDPAQVSFFLSREKIVPVRAGRGMALWRDRLFAAMARNAGSVTGLLQHPYQPGGRARNSGRDLTSKQKIYSGTVCGFVGSEIWMTRYFTAWVELPLRETACSAPGGS